MTPFNAAAFCILMDHHGAGVENAHPDYIKEKLEVFAHCDAMTAMSLLDERNQFRLREWCENWNIKIPGDTQCKQETQSQIPK
jgi:hypothetical protein